MKKWIFVSALSLILFFGLEWSAIAQMPKEGTLSGTNVYSGTIKIFPLDQNRFVMLYETSGVTIEDSGGGPFHNVSSHNVGVIYVEKGIGRVRGYITDTDKDGDKVLWEITETETKISPPNPVNGIGKLIGGTGKFTGIQGSMDYTRQEVRPFAAGTTQGVAKYKGNWKLP